MHEDALAVVGAHGVVHSLSLRVREVKWSLSLNSVSLDYTDKQLGLDSDSDDYLATVLLPRIITSSSGTAHRDP